MSLKIRKNRINCFLCNNPVKSLTTHFRAKHPEYNIRKNEDLEKQFNYIGPMKVCDEICCPFCNKYCSTNTIDRHIQSHGYEKYEEFLKIKNDDRNHIISCPVCNQNFSNILSHIKIHDELKHIKTKAQLEDFLGYEINNTQVESKKDSLNIQCPYCSKVLSKYNTFKLHIKNKHKDKYEDFLNNVSYYDSLYKKNCNKITLEKQMCFICGKKYGDMKQHINNSHFNTHTWKSYCDEYNISYDSSKICNREYVVKTFKNQNKFLKYNKRGIHCYYNNIHFKSLLEINVYLMLEDNNLSKSFIYEPNEYVVTWFDSNNKEHCYFPDFYDSKTNTIIEIKPENKQGIVLTKKESEKINAAKMTFNKLGIQYIFGSINDIAKLYRISDYKKYNSKSYLYKRLRELYNNDLIEFACSKDSFSVKYITGESSLKNLKGIKIYGSD